MKTTIKLMGLVLCSGFILLASCKKDDENKMGDEGGDATCYTCENCQGQYGHIISRQYCVDGFDNRQDWLDMKATYEGGENQCDCAFD
ncbi:hypothetical protein [Parapedobacter sp. 2B3]|uniref:hypothetical protein n=1 Tax=Parapedobacter sp. 2B3 TaxID=3342381 RepID=UPI0035B5CEB5